MPTTVEHDETHEAKPGRIVPRRTRIDAPHPVSGAAPAAEPSPEQSPAADPVALGRAMLEVIEEPSPAAISAILGADVDARREQLQQEAAELANHLRERLREVDRREAQLNARVAQLETDLRSARLWLSEREHEFQEREAELRRQLEDMQSREAGHSTADEDRQSQAASLREREERCRQKENELRERRLEIERQHAALRHGQQMWEHDRTRQDADLARERERLAREFAEQTARRDQAWQAREQLLCQHASQLDQDRAALLADRQAWEIEKARQRKLLDDEAARAAAEEADRQQRLAARQEWIERERTGLETVRGEILQLHRQSLEMRLVAEQLWAQVGGRMNPAEVAQSIAHLRLKLAEHYDVEEAGLARRREELVALGEKIAEQHRELTQLRDGVKSWAAARQQEIEQQARRLVEREIELDAQQEELRQARHIWHSERRDYERQIRELACQLAPVPGAA